MQFGEKLDFLMNITKTTNSALSLYISLDASYISRLRRGERNLPKKEIYIKSMATYFAKHCTEEYQGKALSDAVNIKLPVDSKKLSESILQWLLSEKEKKIDTVGHFLDGFSVNKTKKTPLDMENSEEISVPFPQTDMSVYYGVEGKRQAVIYFLSEVITQKKPQTLLLFSDESTNWMTADHAFAAKWAALMEQTLKKGNRIKIIHTVSRELDEMLNAIIQWMPLYMSGAIEPYFYPKKKDGVFKRTLLVAPETAAVISNSVGDSYKQAANILFRNKQAVKSVMDEYNQYLSLCRPLMRIFTAKDEEAYLKTLIEFEKGQSDTLIKTESLSFLTMPDILSGGFIQKYAKHEELSSDFHKRNLNLKKYLQSNNYTEIIKLPDPESVKAGKIKIASSDMFCGGAAYYTTEEYILHLEHIVHLLKTYKNFHIYIANDLKEENYMVYVREELGAIVAKTSSPPVALGISESNMTAAFWDYLKNIIGDTNINKNNTVFRIRNYLKTIR